MNKPSNVDVDEPVLPRRRKALRRFQMRSCEPSFPEAVVFTIRKLLLLSLTVSKTNLTLAKCMSELR